MIGRPRVGMTARSPRALAPCQRSVEMAGGQSVILDPRLPRPELRRLYDSLDGLLLPGGAGIAWFWRRHRRSGAAPHRDPGWSELDCSDVHLARWALAEGKPVLGLCRGSQMMALAAGGGLDRDVAGHQLGELYPAHQIRVAAGSRLREALGADLVAVNSRHSRAVRTLPAGCGLHFSAWSEQDGVVEGLEGDDGTFAVGVQFHPENLVEFDEASQGLFRSFVEACRRGG